MRVILAEGSSFSVIATSSCDEAIQAATAEGFWIACRSPHRAALRADPLARHDDVRRCAHPIEQIDPRLSFGSHPTARYKLLIDLGLDELGKIAQRFLPAEIAGLDWNGVG